MLRPREEDGRVLEKGDYFPSIVSRYGWRKQFLHNIPTGVARNGQRHVEWRVSMRLLTVAFMSVEVTPLSRCLRPSDSEPLNEGRSWTHSCEFLHLEPALSVGMATNATGWETVRIGCSTSRATREKDGSFPTQCLQTECLHGEKEACGVRVASESEAPR